MVFPDCFPYWNIDDDLTYYIAHFYIITLTRMGVKLICQDIAQPQGFVHLPHAGNGPTQ